MKVFLGALIGLLLDIVGHVSLLQGGVGWGVHDMMVVCGVRVSACVCVCVCVCPRAWDVVKFPMYLVWQALGVHDEVQ